MQTLVRIGQMVWKISTLVWEVGGGRSRWKKVIPKARLSQRGIWQINELMVLDISFRFAERVINGMNALHC